MLNNLIKKGVIIGIIILFIGAVIVPSLSGISITKQLSKDDNILYRSSNSRGYIQDLIDNASNGDTIYIPSGTYYENIVIDKSISLIGEDKNNTIIDGGGIETVVYVSADWVNVSGFTIQNSGVNYLDAGVFLSSDNICIRDNIIMNNQAWGIGTAISYYEHEGLIITNNYIINNGEGIVVMGYRDSSIIYNTISNNMVGASFAVCLNVTFTSNILNDNIDTGINMGGGSKCWRNIIDNNTIYNSECGLYICDDSLSAPTENFIMNNSFFNTGIFTSYYTGLSNIFLNNKVNGKPLVFLTNTSDQVIDDAGQIILYDCYNITIHDQDLCNSTVGIIMGGINNCYIFNNLICSNSRGGLSIEAKSWYENNNNNTISGNNINNNGGDGIQLQGGCNNEIIDNTIDSNNGNGINLHFFHIKKNNTIIGNNIISNNNYSVIMNYRCFSNNIYHNNFIDNGKNTYDEGNNNTWDDGKYGNYWSDYEERYPDAKPKLFKSWMWNTPYQIPGDGKNKDNCPLVNQWPKSKSKSISKNIEINNPFQNMLHSHPKMFPIIRQLLGLN